MRIATKKEIDKFIQYRANHVALVQRIGKVVFDADISDHDNDKIGADGDELNLYALRNSMLNGTYHPHTVDKKKLNRLAGEHVKSQKHHPEYWDDSITSRNFDDNNPPQVNAHRMPKRYLLEMCCDWSAVALKLNKPIFSWYNKTCIGENARFLFTDNQKDYIVECLSRIQSKIDSEKLYYPNVTYNAEQVSPKIDFGKKLTESKEDIIYSKEFKDWFGDWESDPENSSKVVDENGKPLAVYHGSYNEFSIFKSKGLGIHFGTKRASEDRLNNTADIDGEGLDYNGLLDSRKKYAKENGIIYPCFLNIKNPFILEDFGNSNFISSDVHQYLIDYGFPKEEVDNLLYKDSVYLKDYLINKKFDGVFYKNKIEDKGSMSYIAFYPNQIKSIDNNGNFSKESDNIYEKILHKNNKWVVTDHTGEKNLGTYDTKEEAEKRLKQVEYFKHINESQTDSNDFKKWFGNSVVKDDNGNPLIVYHGTPSTTPNIIEFNSSKASNNYGESTLIYATDSKEMAKVFSMDSIEGNSNLTRILTGEKGKVYPLYMRLEHPMDFRKLEDKDIDTIVQAFLEYKKDLGEDKNLKEIENKYREEIKQDSKFGVDFVKSKHLRLLVHPRYIHIFKEHGYDGIICPMGEYRGVEGALEYAVISPNQIKSIDNQGPFSLQSNSIYEKVITSFGGKVPISSKDKDQIQKFCKKAVEDGMKPTKYTEEGMTGMANSSNFSSNSIASNTPENPIKVTNLGEEKLEEAYVVCSLDGQVVDGTYTTDINKAKTMRQELADEYHTFFKLMTVQDKEEPMEEALEKKKTCVFTFGRYQPPTKGHLKVWEKVANTEGDAHYVYTSHTKDKKKNPLDYNTKIGLINSALKEHNINAEVIDSEAKTIIDVVVDIANKGYNNLIFVGGSDRLNDMIELIRKYNDKPNAEGNFYHFDSIEGVSAGERDPDSDSVEGISGTKLRQMAMDGDFEGFKNNLAFSDESTIKEVMELIKVNIKK